MNSSAKRSKQTEDQQQQPFAVCVTGLCTEDRQLAVKLAREVLDGVYQNSVDETTTHLVADRVGSAKYQRALHYSIPIVSKTFLQACLDAKQLVPVRGHVLGCFAGLVLCSTGFTLEQNAEKCALVQSIEANGGTYSGVLEKDKTTHLICVSQGAERSDKQRAAMDWGIKMVSVEWVESCIELGAWLPEEQPQAQKKVISPVIVAESEDLLPVATAVKAAAPTKSNSELEFTAWQKLMNSGEKPHGALRRCLVYIDCREEDEPRWRTLRQFAVFAGAMVHWEFSPQHTTHYVVCGNSPVGVWDSPLVHLVTPQFLLECARLEDRLDERAYGWERAATQQQQLKNKLVCVSQYDLKQRNEVKTLVQRLGGTYTERLSKSNPRVDLLIYKDTAAGINNSSEKYVRAKEWGIEIHNLEWLRALFRGS